MQRSLAPIIAGCVAALVFAAPKPASAMTAPAVHYGEDAGIVQPVKKGGYNKGYYRGRGHKYGHYKNYGYRNHGYRRYGYGYGYPYWRRPGITFRFGY